MLVRVFALTGMAATALVVGAALPTQAQVQNSISTPSVPPAKSHTATTPPLSPPALAPLALPSAPNALPAPPALPALNLPAARPKNAAGPVPASPVGAAMPPTQPLDTSVMPVLPKPPGSDTAVDAALAGLAKETVYSYGKSDISLLYLPTQIDKMKEAVRTYENLSAQGKVAAPTLVGVEAVSSVPEVIPEPPKGYPGYWLQSIAYKGPGDWSIWINNFKITAQKNKSNVQVVQVSPDNVTFSITPTYAAALKKRRADKLFASTTPVKNRLATMQNVRMDDATGTVTFTLRQNQTFALGYFSVFEGFVDSPTLEPLANSAASPVINITSPSAPGLAPSTPPSSSSPVPRTGTIVTPQSPMRGGRGQPSFPSRPSAPGMPPGSAPVNLPATPSFSMTPVKP